MKIHKLDQNCHIWQYTGIRVQKTPEFSKWFESVDSTTQRRIAARLLRVESNAHLGTFRNLGQGLNELKWTIGLRVYFSIAQDTNGNLFLVLFGGGKSGQNCDIDKAREILERYRNN